jgi:hypothetical protein
LPKPAGRFQHFTTGPEVQDLHGLPGGLVIGGRSVPGVCVQDAVSTFRFSPHVRRC